MESFAFQVFGCFDGQAHRTGREGWRVQGFCCVLLLIVNSAFWCVSILSVSSSEIIAHWSGFAGNNENSSSIAHEAETLKNKIIHVMFSRGSRTSMLIRN